MPKLIFPRSPDIHLSAPRRYAAAAIFAPPLPDISSPAAAAGAPPIFTPSPSFTFRQAMAEEPFQPRRRRRPPLAFARDFRQAPRGFAAARLLPPWPPPIFHAASCDVAAAVSSLSMPRCAAACPPRCRSRRRRFFAYFTMRSRAATAPAYAFQTFADFAVIFRAPQPIERSIASRFIEPPFLAAAAAPRCFG